MRTHPPHTRYARSGDARIAYQVTGDGPLDLVFLGGPASHLDLQWEEPATVRGLERYGSFSRLVRFDRRGTGLSDPADSPPTLEQQVDDLEAVMRAVSLERAARSTPVSPRCSPPRTPTGSAPSCWWASRRRWAAS